MLSRTAVLAVSALACLPAAPEASAQGVARSEATPTRRYLFYLHGRIIEEQGRRPRHPRWGVYAYDELLEALGARGAEVISEQRPAGTRTAAYAKKVAAHIEKLLASGVPAEHIAVVGFSKGGAIARAVSTHVEAPLRYVILAGCFGESGAANLHGKVLSIREKSDHLAKSCAPRFAASRHLVAHRELVVELGGEHGAFYRPKAAWLEPLFAWIAE